MIALVDCNNFYASCERVFAPGLNGKPIIVLSNNDGCVIARSNEAKALGIPMAAPVFKYKNLIEAEKVHVFSTNFALYGDMSNRIMNILREYSKDIEIYSIDEAFIELGEGSDEKLLEMVREIRHIVLKHTGIPVSIGVAKSKTLAKIATHIAKADPLKNSCYIMRDPKLIEQHLRALPVGDVWGIGKQTKEKLHLMGVHFASQFLCLKEDLVLKEFTISGHKIQKELKGEVAVKFESTLKPRKSIGTARTMVSMVRDYSFLEQCIASYCSTCAVKLRKQRSYATSMMVFLHTNYFRQDLPQYRRKIVMNFPATQSTITLVKIAKEALRNIYKPGFQYKKAGVVLMNFQQENELQTDMFSQDLCNGSENKLSEAMDIINDKFGRNTIKLADLGLEDKQALKQEKRSQSYTTDWDDIIEIKDENNN
ncbi:MAG: Y-family DNA polymerase [Candidatus Neomarinimicrobiota bacterium]